MSWEYSACEKMTCYKLNNISTYIKDRAISSIMAYNASHLNGRGFALLILIFYILSNISSHVRTIAAYERVRSDCSHNMRNVENGPSSRTSPTSPTFPRNGDWWSEKRCISYQRRWIDHQCTSALSNSLPWPIVNIVHVFAMAEMSCLVIC